MNSRTGAGLLAMGLFVVLLVVAWTQPVPFVTFKPGPTINVLGPFQGKQIIAISGHKVYRDKGGLRMVTVYPSQPNDHLTLLGVLADWVDPDVAVLPRDAVYKPRQTNEQVQQQSAVQMTSSQDNASAAALGALGVKYRTQVRIDTVDKDGASAGILKKGDIVSAVEGTRTPDATRLIKAIRAVGPGDRVRLSILRGGTSKNVSIVTRPTTDDAKASRINVGIAQEYVFPFKVKVQLPDTIGGPSAGMMFALSIYDLLTPGSLTGGKVIAGSGEIDPKGVVGPIGGIGQKLVGAQRDGARLFLVAQENCSEAVRAHYDPNKLRLVRIHTLSDAIEAVNTWRKDPEAALPRCSR